jgi:hypothetical protein
MKRRLDDRRVERAGLDADDAPHEGVARAGREEDADERVDAALELEEDPGRRPHRPACPLAAGRPHRDPRAATTGTSAVMDAFASCENAAAARAAPAWVRAASRSISCSWAASID